MELLRDERILDFVPYFANLRPDERVRLFENVSFISLERGQTRTLSADTAEWVLIASGEVTLTQDDARPRHLFTADSFGEVEAITGQGRKAVLTAVEPTLIARLDALQYQTLMREFAAMTVPLVAELAHDLKAVNDLLREATAAQNEGVAQHSISALIARGLRETRRRKTSLFAHLGKVMWHTLVREPAIQPAFWIFVGVVAALISARTVVGFIFEHGLQKKLFALVASKVGHPIHVHHFNYGLLIVGLVGLLAMAPSMRRHLRPLSFAFGFGMGLVVDEFALFWNLNPDYYQAQSRVVAAAVVFALFQVVYFHRLYVGVWKRVVARMIDA